MYSSFVARREGGTQFWVVEDCIAVPHCMEEEKVIIHEKQV
jgi:hypothetical protein